MNNCALRAIAATLLLPALALAQKDRITLVDGTVLDKVRVTAFTIAKIDFEKSGTPDSRTSDLVADVHVDRVHDVYKRAYAAKGTDQGPATFISEADQQSDAFLKQFGYVEAARIYLANDQMNDAFAVLDELKKQVPDSGFLPMTYTVKIEYYLSQGRSKAADAQSVAQEYERQSQVQGFPKGFALEARYYKLMADAAGGTIDANRLRDQLQSLARDASGHPDVVNRARLQIANSLRAENKLPDALAIYNELLDKDYTTERVRAGAYLGLGSVQLAQGNASDKGPYRDALLSFLRVYLETPDAPPSMIAEALFMGAQAAEKWGGDDAGRMARRLRYILKRDYPNSTWNQR